MSSQAYLWIVFSILTEGKRIDIYTPGLSQSCLLNQYGVEIIELNSLIFEVSTCADRIFFTLAQRLREEKPFYLITLANGFSMVLVNQKSKPFDMYIEPVLHCNATGAFWVRWDTDGPIRVGTGRVLEENQILQVQNGTITDLKFGHISSNGPANWTFLLQDDASKFISPLCDGSTVVEVVEDAPVGTFLLNITTAALRPDIVFDIFDPVSAAYFAVVNNTIVTNATFDFETRAFYNIRITTSDAASATLKVVVQDRNDEPPLIHCPENISVPEEILPSTVTEFPCSVTDRDKDDNYTLMIEGPDSDLFMVENSTQIKFAKRLDRDGRNGRESLHITLIAKDASGNNSSYPMLLHVNDVNDNKPVFSTSVYIINVTENSTTDASVLNFTVKDDDLGPNANVTVHIHDRDATDCRFKLQNNSLILLAKTCDFEAYDSRHKAYTVILRAYDNPTSSQRLTGSAVVIIQVQPRNEFPPVWVTEAEPSPTQSHQSTKSRTITQDDTMTFRTETYIVDGDTTIPRPKVDFQLLKKREVPDSKPEVFRFPTQTVLETAIISSKIVQLNATDSDSVHLSELYYDIDSISTGYTGVDSSVPWFVGLWRTVRDVMMAYKTDTGTIVDDIFEIDHQTGEIFTASVLDRDSLNSATHYDINATCTDGEFLIHGLLGVDVMEVNEFPPKFEKQVYKYNVSFPANSTVYIDSFNVSDDDLHSTISVRISGKDSRFAVTQNESTWLLFYTTPVKAKYDYLPPTHAVLIARDGGIPELSSSTTVIFEKNLCSSALTEAEQRHATTPPQVTSPPANKTQRQCLKTTQALQPLTILAGVEGAILLVLAVPIIMIFKQRPTTQAKEEVPEDSNCKQTGLSDENEVTELLSSPSLDQLEDIETILQPSFATKTDQGDQDNCFPKPTDTENKTDSPEDSGRGSSSILAAGNEWKTDSSSAINMD